MIRIQKAALEDAKEISIIEAENFSIPWSQKAIEDTLYREDILFLTAKDEAQKDQEQVIGYCGLYFSLDEADIINVAVKEGYKGCGVGNQLMTQLFEWAKELKITTIFLEVRVGNQGAIQFYEKLGFHIEGVRKNFYEKPREDAYLMKRIER